MNSTDGKHGRRLLEAPGSLELASLGAEPAIARRAIAATELDARGTVLRRRSDRSGWERLRGHTLRRRRRALDDILAAERSRTAADIHDLIMQDLALALATARTLTDHRSHATQASAVVAAGERALDGARSLIARLAESDLRPVAVALEGSVRVAAGRTPLSFDASAISAHEHADQPTLATLVHIGREAVTNAIKHADPESIEVVLQHPDEWRLQIRDDGRGFDPADVDRGFGLQSMRRHTQNLGGSFRIRSEPGAGTTVEVTLP